MAVIIWPCLENSTNGNLVKTMDYTSTLQITFGVLRHLIKKYWRWSRYACFRFYDQSVTDALNCPILKDYVHRSNFKDSSKMSCQNLQHCCDEGHLEKSNWKGIVLHTLWLLVPGCPLPDPCWYMLLSILICFIQKTSQRTTHILKQ